MAEQWDEVTKRVFGELLGDVKAMHGDEENDAVDNVLINQTQFKSIISSTENKLTNVHIASDPHRLMLHEIKKKFNLNKKQNLRNFGISLEKQNFDLQGRRYC